MTDNNDPKPKLGVSSADLKDLDKTKSLFSDPLQQFGDTDVFDSKFDTSINPGNIKNLNSIRTALQPVSDQIANASVKTLLGAGLGIVENAGYIGELVFDWDKNKDYSNAITEWAGEVREDLDKALPVRRANPDKVFDLGDPAWWIDHGSGLVESIGEFLVTGYGVGSALGKASKGIANVLKARGLVQKGLTAGSMASTSATLAYVEGAMSGSQVYKDIYKKEFVKHGDKEIAARKASDAASTTVRLNTTLNTMLNVTSVAPLFKTAQFLKATDKLGINGKLNYIRNLEKGVASSAENLTLQQVPKNFLGSLGGEAFQEALEETVNVYAEAEGRGELKGSGGFDRFIEAVFTEEGALSAILGAVGGAGQTVGMKALSSKEDIDENNRQTVFNNYISDLKSDFTELSEAQKQLQASVQSGNVVERRQAEDKLFNTGLRRSLVNGNAEEFIEDFKNISNIDNVELGEDGLTDAMRLGYSLSPNDNEYKNKAQERINDIKSLSKEFDRIFNQYAVDEESETFARTLFDRRVDIYQKDKEIKAKRKDIDDYIAANQDLLDLSTDLDRSISLKEALKDINKYNESNINDLIPNNDLTKEEKLRIQNQIKEDLNEELETLKETAGENPSITLRGKGYRDTTIRKRQKELILDENKIKAAKEEYAKITNAKNVNEFTKKYNKLKEKKNQEVENIIKKQNVANEKKEGLVEYENAKQGLVNSVKETKKAKSAFIKPSNDDVIAALQELDPDVVVKKSAEEANDNEVEENVPFKEEETQPVNQITETPEVQEPITESPFKQLRDKGIEITNVEPDEITSNIEDTARSIHNTEAVIEPDYEGPQNPTKEDYETNSNIEADGLKGSKLLVNAASSIAYRTKNFDGKNTITNNLEDDLHLDLLSPRFNVGQKIKFEIDVTFPTYNELQNDPLRVPIAIKKDNKTIGYVHDIDYIRPDRVTDLDDNIKYQKQKLTQLREAIINNNGGTGTITNKSLGTLSVDYKNRLKSNIESFDKLVIGKLGELYQNNNDELSDEIVNNKDKFGENTNGRVFFTHVTPNGKKIAIPTINNKLDNSQVTTLVKATEIFLNGPKDEDQHKIVNDILNELEYDITKAEGLISLYNSFVYTYNLRDKDKVSKLEQDLNNTDRKFIDVLGNGVMFLSSGKNLFELTKNTKGKDQARLLSKLKAHLENTRFNVDITKINSPGSFKIPSITDDYKIYINEFEDYNIYASSNLSSNIVFNPIGNNEYSIFDQPTIEFKLDKDVALEQKVEKVENNKQVKKDLVKSTKPDFPTLVRKKPKFKKENKEDNAFDDSIINSIKEDINELIVPGFTAYEQTQVINTISSMILYYTQSENKITQNKAFDKAKLFFSSLNTEASEKALNHFDKFIPFVKDKLNNIGFIETNDNVFSSKSTFEISPKLTASKRLKQFLSFIPDAYMEEGEIYDKESILGHYLYKDFDEIFDELSAILADTTPVFDTMLEVLKQNIDAKPWIRNLIEEIEGFDGDIDLLKFDFVKAMSKTYSNYKTAIAEEVPIKVRNEFNNFVTTKNPDGTLATNFRFRLIDSNRDTISRIILSDWNNNIKISKLVKDNGEDLVLIPSEVDRLKQEIVSLKETPSIEKLKKVLEGFSINVSVPVLTKLLNGRFNKLKFSSQFTDSAGLFKIILDKLDGYQEDPRFILRNPLNDNVIELLSKEESKHTNSFYSTSSRNIEGNVVYDYSLNKAITTKTRRLKSEPEYVNKLLESKFNSPNMFNGKPRGVNWLWLLKNDTSFRNSFNVTPFDGLKNYSTQKKGKTLSKMNSLDHSILSLGLFQNQNKGNKDGLISNYLLPVNGKTTSYIVSAKRHKVVVTDYNNFTLGKSTQDALYGIVDSEIRRMRHAESLTKKPAGFHPNSFYFFPSLNNNAELWNSDGTLKNEEQTIGEGLKVRDVIFSTISNDVKTILHEKYEEFKDSGILEVDDTTNKVTKINNTDKTYLDSLVKKVGEDLTNQAMYLIADLSINTLIARANMHQTLIGDPALFYKGNGNPDSDIQSTFDNIGKRLAKLIAPGVDIPLLNKDEKFISIKVADAKIDSHNKELVKKYSAYGKIESTDSQELTTLKEHLTLMHRNSEISTSKFNEIVSQINKGIEPNLSKEDLITIITSIKPVYVDTVVEDGIAREEYVKSSAFPMIPQLTKGLEIDKLRVEAERIEKEKGLPVRVAFKSASKLGGYAFSTIFDDNGNIKDNLNLNKSVVSLPRAGLRIQQEVPYNENKKEITKGVQETVLLFNNIIDLKFGDDNGSELRDKYYKLNEKLYKEGLDKLKNDLTSDTATLDTYKLSDLLIKEAKKRNYSPNELKSLLINPNTGDFEVPLWASSIYKKNEPLITSLFTNNVTQHKLPGDSYTLMSEEGWKGKSNDIVYTSDYDPEIGLKPASVSNGKVLPAQIIVPFFLRDNDGNLLDVKNYIKDGLLDTSKIPEEFLESFGYRIPTQSHSFMSYVKVVGFMPNYIKNTILAPKDFVTQMGSDFDFDKLYMYHRKGYVKKDGTVESDKLYNTQNELLDLHIKVMSHPKVYEMMIKPESTGDLKKLSVDMLNKRSKGKVINYLTDSYNINKYLESVNGGVAIGVKSLDSTFNANIQGKNLYLNDNDKVVFGLNNYKPLKLVDLSGNITVDGGLKSDVLGSYQSAALDNESDPILGKINSNPSTFDVERAMTQVGLNAANIVHFLNQDAIIDLVNQIELNPFVELETLVNRVRLEYNVNGNIESNAYYPIPLHELSEAINNPKFSGKYINYAEMQAYVLDKFLLLDRVGKRIKSLQSATNTFNAGLGKNLIEVADKTKQIYNISESKIENAQNLIGAVDEPNTLLGYASVYGTLELNKMFLNSNSNNTFRNLFPYKSNVFNTTLNAIESQSRKELTTDQKVEVFDELRSFLFLKSKSIFKNIPINEVRNKIMFDRNDNESLATKLVKFKKGLGKHNPFIKRLSFVLNTNNNPSLVQYKANKAENVNESIIHQGFMDLIANPVEIEDNYTTHDLVDDLIKYAYLNGGNQDARSYIKYIPFSYLKNIKFFEELNNINFEDEFISSSFVTQYIQHNPRMGRLVESHLIDTNKNVISFIISDNDILTPELNSDTNSYNLQPVNLLSVPDKKSSSNFKTYKLSSIDYDTSLVQYESVDSLGLSFYKEYDPNIEIGNTLVGTPREKKTIIKQPLKNRPTESYDNKIISTKHSTKVKELLTKDYKSILGEIKNSIITNNALVAELIDNLNLTIDYQTINDPSKKKAFYSNNKVVINLAKIDSYQDAEKTFLHEMIHGATSELFNNPEKATSKQKLAMRSISALRQNAKSKANQKELAQFEDLLSRANSLTNAELDIAKNLAPRYYGFTNDKEFVTAIMTEESFQMLMNEVSVDDGEYDINKKTIFKRFLDLLNEILSSFKSSGIDLNKDNTLALAIKNVVSLINDNVFYSESLNLESLEKELNIKNKKYKDYSEALKQVININTTTLKSSQYKAVINEDSDNTTPQWSIKVIDNTDNTFDATAITEKSQKIIDSLNSRIKSINNSISSANAIKDFSSVSLLKDRRERLKENIEKIKTEDKTSTLLAIAADELSTASKILDNENISPNDLIYTLKTINLWQSSLDILLDPEERDEDTAIFKAIKGIVGEAINLKNIWDDIAVNRLRDEMSKELETDDIKNEHLLSMPDIGFYNRETLDISRSGNQVLNSVTSWMRKATSSTNLEALDINKKLDDLTKGVKNTSEFKTHGWELFAQITKDDDGIERKTGNMVFPISQDYFNERVKLINTAKFKNDWSEFLKWEKDNHDIIDARKLYTEDEKDGTLKRVGNKEYENEIKNIFGEDATRLLEDLQDKINIYNESRLAEIERLSGEFNDITGKMDWWTTVRHPFIYLDGVIDGKSTVKTVAGKPVLNRGYKSLVKRVKGWEDPKFEIIKNNPDLFNYYNYVNETLDDMYKLLPSDLKNDLQLNSIPNVKKSIIEEYNTHGMNHAVKELGNWFKESILAENPDFKVTDDVDPVTLKPEHRFIIPTLSSLGVEEKSYDLSKTLKIFSHYALAYKHKSKVEDLVKLSQTIVNQALEQKISSSRVPILNVNGKELSTKNGLSNMKAQLDNTIDKFYGISNEKELISPFKILSSKDKDTKKDLLAEIKNIEESKDPKIIEDADKLTKALKEEIKELGKNVSITKVVDKILGFVQVKGMGLNVFSAFTNVNFGFLSGLTWSAGGVDFNTSQYMKANRIMLASVSSNLKKGKKNKVDALIKKYDVLKETHKELFDSKTTDKLYILQSSGEYMVQGSVMVAMMLNKKIKDKDGKDRTLWEAYDADGNWKKDEFGESFEWDGDVNDINNNKEFFKFKNNITQVNKSIHGNYDPDSPVLAKSRIVGRALLQFRSWIAEGVANRFEIEKDDALLGRKRKGRYRTYMDVGFLKSFKLMLKSMVSKNAYDELNDVDKENLKKNFVGLSQLVSIYTLAMLLKYGLEDDDDERRISLFYINQLNRLNNDLMFFVSPMAFENITRSAIPAFNLVIDGSKLLHAVGESLENSDTLKTGINKGKSRIGVRAAKLFPVINQLSRLDSSTKIEYNNN